MAARSKETVDKAEPPDEFLAEIGKRIKVARKNEGLTLAGLGEASGFVPSYMYLVEQKGTNLTLNALKKLAAALKVEPRDLLPSGRENVSETRNLVLVAGLARAADLIQKRMKEDAAVLAILHDLIGTTSAERVAPPAKKT